MRRRQRLSQMMLRRRHAAFVCLALVAGVALFWTGWVLATPWPESRYQIILDRQPFGEPMPEPVVSAKAAAPTKPRGPSFIKEWKMVGITDSWRGLRVALVNLKSKQSYYMRKGDVEEDVELVDADFDLEGALLRKGDEDHWIYMNEDSGSAAPVAPQKPPGRGRRAPGSPSRTSSSSLHGKSYAEIQAQRRADEVEARAREALTNRVSGAAVERQLNQYQMDVIRRGMPALPIPLTREMDDTLVQEGVLPPQESN